MHKGFMKKDILQTNTSPSKKLTVTVGIPAHNERQNIAQLIASIVSQNGNFILEKIIVVCDGCTDQTEEIVKEFSQVHPSVESVSDGKRIGKSARLNFLYQTHASDILITLDGDIELANDYVFEKLLEPLRDPQVAVVAGNARPLPGRTFVEKLVVAKDAWWYETRKNFKNGNNIYVKGCLFALANDFTRNFKFIPETIGDQDILYLSALSRGKRFIFTNDARVYFREVSTWKELLKRERRFQNKNNFEPYKFKVDIEAEYKIPTREKIRGLLKIIRENPFYGIGAFLLNIALKLLPLFLSKSENTNTAIWQVISSTKKLRENNASH